MQHMAFDNSAARVIGRRSGTREHIPAEIALQPVLAFGRENSRSSFNVAARINSRL
jgi:hypothetical protein